MYYLSIIIFVFLQLQCYAQSAGLNLINRSANKINIDITVSNLSGAVLKKGRVLVAENNYKYEINNKELGHVYIKANNQEIDFWAYANSQDIGISSEWIRLEGAKFDTIGIAITSLQRKINSLDSSFNELRATVDYEKLGVVGAENEIKKIGDSIDQKINSLYENHVKANPETINGLFALIQLHNREPIKYNATFCLNVLSLYFENLSGPMIYKFKNDLNSTKNLTIGKLFPTLAIQRIDNKVVSTKDYRGKYLFIDFWATWCGYCIDGFPLLKKIFSIYRNEKFQVITISIDNKANELIWKQALKKYKITDFDNYIYPLLTGKKKFDLARVPASFLIDPDGIIIGTDLKGIDLQQELEKIFRR